MSRCTSLWLLLALAGLLAGRAVAGVPQWRVVKPSNTGIPGETIKFATFDPQGNLWVAALEQFFVEGGVAMYDGVKWTTYADFESPLPSLFTNDIEFAQDGAVWMATGNGLVRKDGDNWTIYTRSNSPLLHNSIAGIEFDSAGNLWINNTEPNTQNAALFKFDGTNWQMFHVPDDLPWPDPWRALGSLTVDSHDHIWVSNKTLSGVAEYDGTSWTLHGDGVATFRSMTEDHSGNMWMVAGLSLNAFYRFDGTTFTRYDSTNTPFGNTSVNALTIGLDGTVYVANAQGMVIKTTDDGATWSIFIPNELATINRLFIDPASGDLWTQTNGVVHHHSPNGAHVVGLSRYNTGLTDYFLADLAVDVAGNMWFATDTGGVCAFDGVAWRGFNPFNTGSDPWPYVTENFANGVFGASNGVEWIAMWPAQSLSWNGSAWTKYNFTSDMFTEDGLGRIWGAGRFGNFVMIDSDGIVQTFVTGTPGGIHDILGDPDGTLWAASGLDGLANTANGTDWTLRDPNNSGLPGIPLALAFDPSGDLWIATTAGVVRFDRTNFTTLWDTSNAPFISNLVLDVAVRDDGLLAVSTYTNTNVTGALHLYDGTSWTTYTSADSPLGDEYLDILTFGPQGNLWVASTLGSGGVSVLQVGPTGVRGDLDGDGDVDLADLATLLSNYGMTSGANPEDGDLDGDGDVDLADLAALLANYGTGT